MKYVNLTYTAQEYAIKNVMLHIATNSEEHAIHAAQSFDFTPQGDLFLLGDVVLVLAVDGGDYLGAVLPKETYEETEQAILLAIKTSHGESNVTNFTCDIQTGQAMYTDTEQETDFVVLINHLTKF